MRCVDVGCCYHDRDEIRNISAWWRLPESNCHMSSRSPTHCLPTVDCPEVGFERHQHVVIVFRFFRSNDHFTRVYYRKIMWLGLFPRLAAGALRQHAPFRAATRQFSSTPSSSMLSSSARRLEVPQFFSTVPPKAISSSPSVISLGAPRISWSPTSFSSSFIHRAFSTSRNAAARPTYYGRSGRGWQPRPPKPGYSLWDKFRMRLNSVNPTRMVYIIMGINVAVFLAWQYSINSWVGSRLSTI